MRIAILGAGGVGAYFGGRLAQAGEEVIFIARGDHLRAMQRHGLRVDSVKGDFILPSVQATDDPTEVGPVDVIFLGVKAWQVRQAAQAMTPLLGPETFIVPLQNGVESPRELAKVVAKKRILGGFCRIISYIEEPGYINNAGGEPYIAFGELDNQPSERTQRLRQIFAKTKGVTAEIPPDIQAAMWGKFVLISPWAGIGALTRTTVGVWRSMPETRQMWERAMRELLTVAQAHGVNLTEESIQQAINYVDNLPPTATASMQRDIMDDRPSELNNLCGAVVRLAIEAGVETPIHNFIYYTLLPQEMQAREQAKK